VNARACRLNTYLDRNNVSVVVFCRGVNMQCRAPSRKGLRRVVGAVGIPIDSFRLTIEVGIGGRNELVAGVFEGGVWRADGGFAKCDW
jgi:hypothetical protein